ncbi:NAD(P)H-binding protein [Nocardia fusca]|uniref:NAD(P)H-binding protein n=1 Tax=Nocardia fusca TaxID=941183 RepID=UPI0037A39B95
MSRIVISGASGDLGRRVTALLANADSRHELTLVTRTPDKLARRTLHEATVRHGDYQDPDSLDTAYEGGDVLFLISGLNLGRRIPEHRNAIAAARRAGIRHIVYTSVGGVNPGNPALSAKDHYQTELDLRGSGINYTIMRNSLYSEIVSKILVEPATATGVITQATGTGFLAPVAKDDVARCAADCLLTPGRHAGAVYEITGAELLDFDTIARIASSVYGVPIAYEEVTADQRLAFFDSVGIPRTYDPNMPPSPDGHLWASDELVSAEVAVAEGYQAVLSHHVKLITGREPESLQSVMERVKATRYDELDAAVS